MIGADSVNINAEKSKNNEIISKISKQKFFHDMNLPGIRTGSWIYEDGTPPNYHLYPVFDFLNKIELSQAKCLDIGTFDGMTAFVMASLGASRVDAVCQYNLERFRLTNELLSLDNIIYHPNTQLEELLDRFGDASFDLVVISAMLHHLMSPLDALFVSRRLLKTGGYLILEAATRDAGSNEPAMFLNTEATDPVYGNPTVWIPSQPALAGMIKLSAFEIVSTLKATGTALGRETNYERITFLCRAEKPSSVSNRTKQLAALHSSAPWTGQIDFKALEANERESAQISFSGKKGDSAINIWTYKPTVPLQPPWTDPQPARKSCFKLGTNDEFLRLMGKHEKDQWNAKDITLLAAKYPGEIFPEGQAWSLKQFGNLHCLDFIKKWGLEKVIEVGPGFNLYFENHLPPQIDYWALDEKGFYDEHIMGLAMRMRHRSTYRNGLIGKSAGLLDDEEFDGLFSVSVIEHIPDADIPNAAADMFRVLKPGGWCLHSLDVSENQSDLIGKRWLASFKSSGFLVDDAAVDLDATSTREPGREVFIEPLSIIQRFHGGYDPYPWRNPTKKISNRCATILVAVRKPPAP